MTFLDLPADLADRPLTDSGLVADILGLLVSEPDRRRGCLLFALCDAQCRLVQPFVVHDVPDHLSIQERKTILDVFVRILTDRDRQGSLLLALGRAAGLSATQDDLDWRAAVERACRGRATLLGVHIITPEGSRPVPRSSAAA